MKTIAVLIMTAALAIPSRAQDPAPETPAAPAAPGGEQPRGAPQEPRPYEQVITKDAKTDEGVFAVHRIRDRVYYEIPKSELGKGIPVGEPDRTNHAGRGLRGTGCREHGRSNGSGVNNRVLLQQREL